MSDLNNYIGDQIRKYRKNKHLTAEQLATKLNISRTTLTRYETGVRKVNQDILFKLSEIFNVPINNFYPPVDYKTKEEDPSIIKEEELTYQYDLDKMLDNARSFDGKPMTETDRKLIKQYLETLYGNR